MKTIYEKKPCPDCEGTGGIKVFVEEVLEYDVCERCRGTGELDPRQEEATDEL